MWCPGWIDETHAFVTLRDRSFAEPVTKFLCSSSSSTPSPSATYRLIPYADYLATHWPTYGASSRPNASSDATTESETVSAGNKRSALQAELNTPSSTTGESRGATPSADVAGSNGAPVTKRSKVSAVSLAAAALLGHRDKRQMAPTQPPPPGFTATSDSCGNRFTWAKNSVSKVKEFFNRASSSKRGAVINEEPEEGELSESASDEPASKREKREANADEGDGDVKSRRVVDEGVMEALRDKDAKTSPRSAVDDVKGEKLDNGDDESEEGELPGSQEEITSSEDAADYEDVGVVVSKNEEPTNEDEDGDDDDNDNDYNDNDHDKDNDDGGVGAKKKKTGKAAKNSFKRLSTKRKEEKDKALEAKIKLFEEDDEWN